VDNWRRQAAVAKAVAANQQKTDAKADSIASAQTAATEGNMSFDALFKNLPTTPEKLKASNDKIVKAFYTTGETFENKLEDYPVAIDYYDSANLKFPGSSFEEQTLFNLYYSYTKLDRPAKADSVKAVLSSKYGSGKFNSLLRKGPEPVVKSNDAATAKYNEIYNLFIAGRFEEAKQQKVLADSLYGKTHWTPQLLFIEAVYYVSKREDSAAINRLNSLIKLHPSSPLAERANTMISVLHRRREIEGYLTNLQITRYKEDEAPMPVTTATNEIVTQKPIPKTDSVVSKPTVTVVAKPIVDTGKATLLVNRTFEFVATDTQYVSILLDSVAPVFANEAVNAFNRYNAVNNYALRLKAAKVQLDNRYNIVLVGPFKDAPSALDYVDKTRPITGSRIIPWLTANKYTYSMISNANLAVLQQTKDLGGYKALLQKVLPGKF
jgi:outer membrane protein assembly factor BamD (BamD/ComL family)